LTKLEVRGWKLEVGKLTTEEKKKGSEVKT